MVADVAFLGSAGNNVLGARNSSSDATNRFGIITYSSSSKFGCFFGTSSIEGSSIDTNSHVFEISSSGFSVDGINYGNPGTQNFSCSYPITIGAWNNGSSGIVCAAKRIKSVKIYSAGTLVRNYVPAVRNSDGYVGMYDTVTSVFYTNSGSGAFTGGPEAGLNGYTRLKYIKATGSQYINTGFKPNQDTTVEFSALHAAANQYFFGAWNVAYDDGAFAFCNDAGDVYIGYDGQGGGTGSVITGNHVIKLEKNIAYLDGAVFSSYTYTAFQVNYPLFLFGQNRAGTFFSNADVGICCEYCKIYDGETLVMHLVPAKRNRDSVIGMYDIVSDVFYENSGSGAFTGGAPAGPVGHRAITNGTSVEITGGRVMVDATVFQVKRGRTLVNGVGYDIGFGTPISDFSIEDSVFIGVGGIPTEFLIINQGKPSDLYDESCAGTWLMAKYGYTKRAWHSTNDSRYEISDIHNYLNNDFLNLLEPGVQDAIKQVKIPYYSWDGRTVLSGVNGLSAKIFLLSGYEVGFSQNTSGQFPIDGSKLDYFEPENSDSAKTRRVCSMDGVSSSWWLRSAALSSSLRAMQVSNWGDLDMNFTTQSYNIIRPALILNFDAKVDTDSNTVIG